MHTGAGQLSASIPILPDDTLAAHPPPTYSPRLQRLVFIEKTRHGLFLGYGGDMPPFSLETLPDASLSDILEALAGTRTMKCTQRVVGRTRRIEDSP